MHVNHLLSLFGSHSAPLSRYNDAMATVRRTPTEHHFHLVVTKVYAEGDEPTLEEDDECMSISIEVDNNL